MPALSALRALALAAAVLPAAAYAESGASLYATRCAGCHMPDGAGLPGKFPPLSRSLAPWLATEDGRQYLMGAMIEGPDAMITVGGVAYSGLMPIYGKRMTDGQMVDVLRYLAETLNQPLPGYKAFDLAGVAAARQRIAKGESLVELRWNLPPR